MRYLYQYKHNKLIYECEVAVNAQFYMNGFRYVMHPLTIWGGIHHGVVDLNGFRKGYIICRLKKK